MKDCRNCLVAMMKHSVYEEMTAGNEKTIEKSYCNTGGLEDV